MKRKTLYWILFLVVLFIVSYYREVIFMSINAVLNGEKFFYAKTMRIEPLFNYSVSKLVHLKYILTVFFSALFTSLTTIGLKMSFKTKTLYMVSIGIYIILYVILILTFLISLWLSRFEAFYPFMRIVIGMIHNPLIYIFLSIAGFSINTMNTTSK